MKLIDADALYEFMREKTEDGSPAEQMIADLKNEHLRIMLDRFATVDAEPVRHGRWNIRTFDSPREGYYCSECGTVEWRTSRFCPNCGAKMDGGDDNEYGVD